MIVTDGMIMQWVRDTGLPAEYLESLNRGGYFEDVAPENVYRHLALMQMTREAEEMGLYT